MTISELQKTYREKLSAIYDAKEAAAITKLVFEKTLEINSTKAALEKFRILTKPQQSTLNNYLIRLLKHEPVQYVLREADFYGLKFKVDPSVLIPRPETEELVAWIISGFQNKSKGLSILDIGTGSGCIGIALSKELTGAQVFATDVSEQALQLATQNNTMNGTSVKFIKSDILNEPITGGPYDVIVSNPPYVSHSEKDTLASNILNFEPHLALFARLEDDLIFYKKIAEKALDALEPNGLLFLEINAGKAGEVRSILKDGYRNIVVKQDINGKDRMVKCVKK